jgi:LPXTG-motif cell wall-anchored protein
LLLALAAAPRPAIAAEIVFDSPSAEASLAEPLSFTTTLTAAQRPERVELVLSAPGERADTVLVAEVAQAGDSDRWQATVELSGHTPPNTVINYRFRARAPAGWVDGPPATVTVVHDRFQWRTVEGAVVRLHWYEGDEAFGRRALEIGEQAVERASALLGVTESEPIDFFIYTSQADMYEALGAGTRENVGGQAHSDIRTMFGLIEPHEVNSDWVDTLVAHELTHLVFDTATDNPYRAPPRWLNEGVAVYLSEGYSASWRTTVERAAANGSLMPIDGLAGLFPTPAEQFRLAYGASVSAVDFFVRTHGEERLWELVRSYARGLTDDEAFVAATGEDLAAFNADWMASLGTAVPEPLGPRPAPTGPLPPGWEVAPGASPVPGATPQSPGHTPAPTPGQPAPTSPNPAAGEGQAVLLLAGVAMLLLAGAIVLVLLRRRRSA